MLQNHLNDPIKGRALPEGEGAVFRITQRRRRLAFWHLERNKQGLHLAVLRLLALFFALSLLTSVLYFTAQVRAREATQEPGGENSPSGSESVSGPSGTAPADRSGDLYAFDPSGLPVGAIPFRPIDLSNSEAPLYNETGLSPDIQSLLARFETGFYEPQSENREAPRVLVLHTHTTEAYAKEGESYFSGEGELARSLSAEENMLAVGREVVRVLNEKGISALHCEILHDYQNGVGSYSSSYQNAKETILSYLAAYPSIELVIDLHRDALTDRDGNLLKPVVTVPSAAVGGSSEEAERAAQMLFAVGTGESGTPCPSGENLSLALGLARRLSAEYPALMRPTALKSHSYNQECAKTSLLVEIGSAANTLPEALRSARLLAAAVAELFS